MTDNDTDPTATDPATASYATADATDSTDTQRMADVSHTNPYTDEPFGEACAFERGPAVAADGGERDAVEEDATDDAGTMADVDHEHPHDGEGAAPAFERGMEGRTDSV